MSNFTIRIDWGGGAETIHFDAEFLLKPGQQISTTERWPGYKNPTEYCATVKRHSHTRGVHTIQLAYERSKNHGQALENPAWGLSTIVVNTRKHSATATWANIPPSAEWDGSVDATVIAEGLFEDLGFTYAKRKKRRQQQFRANLLKLGARCALSKDVTVEALEAAHIIDTESDGAFSRFNGLLLRADIHTLFDKGVLVINLDDGKASFCEGTKVSDYYRVEIENWKLDEKELRRVSKALKERVPRGIAL